MYSMVLMSEGIFVHRVCTGSTACSLSHFDPSPFHITISWVLPAETLMQTAGRSVLEEPQPLELQHMSLRS